MLGRPISHSLSPLLHNSAYAALGLTDWRYDAVDCGAEDVAQVLAAAGDIAAGWAGFSVTMPAKRAALAAAVETSPRAARVGAANTLLPVPGADRTRLAGWRADNTDVVGIVESLREPAAGRPPGSVVVVGAGGAAQAALVALVELGAGAATLLVRDPRRAGDALATAQRAGITVDVASMPAEPAALAALDGCTLLISTVPVEGTAALLDQRWTPGLVALDAVYPNWPTPLARSLRAGGARVVSGASMLLHQAGEQVRLMTGRPAPLGAMTAALRTVVGPALDRP